MKLTVGQPPRKVTSTARVQNLTVDWLGGRNATHFVETTARLEVNPAGAVWSDGSILSGRNNFTLAKTDTGLYELTLTEALGYLYTDYVAIATTITRYDLPSIRSGAPGQRRCLQEFGPQIALGPVTGEASKER